MNHCLWSHEDACHSRRTQGLSLIHTGGLHVRGDSVADVAQHPEPIEIAIRYRRWRRLLQLVQCETVKGPDGVPGLVEFNPATMLHYSIGLSPLAWVLPYEEPHSCLHRSINIVVISPNLKRKVRRKPCSMPPA